MAISYALVSAAIPDPSVPVVPLPLPQVVGVFERVTGNPAWRDFELFAGPTPAYEGCADVELVVRSIAQVGNYDYLIDWVFNQSGVVRVDVALTGIDAPKTVRSVTLASPSAAQDTQYGALIAPNLVAPNHSHFFNFRLDVDIDGSNNSFDARPSRAEERGPGAAQERVGRGRAPTRSRVGRTPRSRPLAVEGRQPGPQERARLRRRLFDRDAQPRRCFVEEGRLPTRRVHRAHSSTAIPRSICDGRRSRS